MTGREERRAAQFDLLIDQPTHEIESTTETRGIEGLLSTGMAESGRRRGGEEGGPGG